MKPAAPPRIHLSNRPAGNVDSRFASARQLAPVVIISLAIGALVSVGIPLSQDQRLDEGDYLLGILAVTTSFPILYAAWFRAADLLSPLPLISGAMFIYYVVRGAFLRYGVVTNEDLAPNLAADYYHFVTPALELVVACWIAGLVAYVSPMPRIISQNLPALPFLKLQGRFDRTLVLLVIGVAVRLYSIRTSQYQALEGGEQNLALGGVLQYGAALLLTGFFLLAAGYFSGQNEARVNVLLWAVIFPALLLGGLLSGSKQTTFQPILILMIAYHYCRRNIGLRHLLGALVVLVVIVIPLVINYRTAYNTRNPQAASGGTGAFDAQVLSDTVDLTQSTDHNWQDVFRATSNRFHGLDSAMIALKMTPYLGWADASLYVQFPFISLIPRFLWIDKPHMWIIPNWEQDYWGAGYGTRSSFARSIIGALYCCFGFWGSVAGFAMHMLGVQIIYLYLRRTWGPLSIALYGNLVPYLLRIENDIPSVWGAIIQCFIVIAAAMWWISISPAKARAPRAGVPKADGLVSA